jgi:hypothetical protein
MTLNELAKVCEDADNSPEVAKWDDKNPYELIAIALARRVLTEAASKIDNATVPADGGDAANYCARIVRSLLASLTQKGS